MDTEQEIKDQKNLIIQNEKKIEYNDATLKANHLPAIYSSLAYLFVQSADGGVTIQGFEVSPIMAFIGTYIVLSSFYYKETILFSRSIVKKTIGLK